MELPLSKANQCRSFTKRVKPDKRELKREEARQIRIAKAKIRELDGNACTNPFHWDWRRYATDKEGLAKWKYRDVLSVHRINYGSHCGEYTEANGITLCAVCHDVVQKGFNHKKLGRLSAHMAMLMILRKLKEELLPEKFRWQENLELLETKFGLTTPNV